MLDIIVTHYNEPWEVGKKLFDMLGCQRGINFQDICVILVHDGSKLFPKTLFRDYPYTVRQYRIEHGGVSRARNYGLSQATAEWVEFCDFDDMYSNAYALRGIMSVMNKDIDYLWTPFFTECVKDGEFGVKVQEENIIWVHGKYFRRDFLIENNIKFPEGIHYSEDSAFCAIVNEVAKIGRRGKVRTEFPAYIWILRENSVTTDPANNDRNMTGFLDRNTYVVEEFKRRNIPHQLMVGRMFADAYHAFHQRWHKYPEQEKRFAIMSMQYMDDLKQNSKEDMEKVYLTAGKIFRGKDMDYSESFDDWIDRLKKVGDSE